MPGIKNSTNGVIIRHKEYIGDIGPSSLFAVSHFPLNPGMDQTFPWLSQIAMAFTEYKWRGMIFTFKTTSSDLVTSTNPSLGTVIMSTDYNAAEEPFEDKRTMENYEFTTSSKPSLSFVHAIECEKNQTAHPTLYTRDGPPPLNADIRLYDIGSFAIATQGMQSTVETATIGELWCSYEIEFLKPRFDTDAGLEYDTWYNKTQASNVFPFGQASGLVYEGNLGGTLHLSDSQVKPAAGQQVRYYFPADSSGKSFNIWFLVEYAITSSGNMALPQLGTSNITPSYAVLGSSTPLWSANASDISGRRLYFNVFVKVGNIANQSNLPYLNISFSDITSGAFGSGGTKTAFFVNETNRSLWEDFKKD